MLERGLTRNLVDARPINGSSTAAATATDTATV